MWKSIRISLLLLVLLAVALHAWLDRVATHSWQEPLWVGLFPLNGDGGTPTQQYVDSLTARDFSAIEDFFAREGHRYALKLEQPVHVELYPPGSQLPPTLDPAAGPLGIAWWSLKLRWFAAHAAEAGGKFDSSEFRSGSRYAADDVVSIFGGKTRVADFPGNTETTKYLHRARRYLIALDVRRFASLPCFQDRYVDVTRSKVHCKRQPHGTRAHYDYTGIDGSIHFPA